MKTPIFIFNGPPNSGKDASVEYLSEYSAYSCFHLRFKDYLYKLTKLIYNIDDDELFISLVSNREFKDEPNSLFHGLSPRQALIHVSEEVIKPKFGKDYFGKIITNKIIKILNDNYNKHIDIFISDCGFEDELISLVEFASSKENFNIELIYIQLHREGCDFSSDSRKYIDFSQPKFRRGRYSYYQINNNLTEYQLFDKLRSIYNQIDSNNRHFTKADKHEW